MNRSRRHLPADLLPEILRYLPVKSLLRFRRVSKPWLTLVDYNADFAQLHLKTFNNNSDETPLLVHQTGTEYMQNDCVVRCSKTFDPLFEIVEIPWKYDNWEIVSSVDGLVLIKHFHGRKVELGDLILWNPSLRKLHLVPPRPCMISVYTILGLGYDQLAKDYKLVNLIGHRGSDHAHSIAIYSVGGHSWKIIPLQGKEWPSIRPHTAGKCVFLHGILYTVVDTKLVICDLSNEVFSSVSTPVNDLAFHQLWQKYLFLADGGSSVAMLDSCSYNNITTWRFERETMNWTKVRSYTCTLTGFIGVLYVNKNGYDMLTSKIGSETDHNEESLVGEEVASYNPTKCEYKILLQLQPRRSYNGYPLIRGVFPYVESLILHQSNVNSKKKGHLLSPRVLWDAFHQRCISLA